MLIKKKNTMKIKMKLMKIEEQNMLKIKMK